MSVVTNFFLGLASAGGVYFWAKTQLIKPDLTTERDLFSSRGVPLSKRSRAGAVTEDSGRSEAAAEIEGDKEVEESKEEPLVEVEPVAKPEPLVNDMAPIAAESSVITTHVVPEDSVLKRHYVARCAAEREAITHPYPTDSVLRRHRESMLAFSVLQDCAAEKNEATLEPCLTAHEPDTTLKTGVVIPEDSVLKRHFLAQLQAEIAQSLPAKPSDATLKRHYAQLVESKLNFVLS